MRFARACLAAVLGLASLASESAEQIYEIRNARDLEELFVRMNYTPKDWHAGVRTVPRIYLAEIPSSWRQKTSKEFSVQEKKLLFFRLLAPVVLYVNERILEERVRVEALSRQTAQGQALSPSDQKWLGELAAHYQVPPSRIDELLRRVDLIPPSLALAQGASESGWGTSRFADEGHSLFGQWSMSGGIKPAEQRTATHGDYRIAAFESTGMSVASYALSLNTHSAYREFRAKREELRSKGQPINGAQLVDTMIRYSERGQTYVNELKALMRQNQLDVADEAQLRKMDIIRIVPKPQAPN